MQGGGKTFPTPGQELLAGGKTDSVGAVVICCHFSLHFPSDYLSLAIVTFAGETGIIASGNVLKGRRELELVEFASRAWKSVTRKKQVLGSGDLGIVSKHPQASCQLWEIGVRRKKGKSDLPK